MVINKTKNAISGTLFGIILKLIQIVFPFAIRTIFIKTLGVEYLGLNSLFTSILQVLNLAELGVSSALVFSMYKPIAEDDSETICALMNLYKKYYRIIGLVVLIAGLCVLPFLGFLISGDVPQDINLYIIYLMSLAATVLSYWLFAYRGSLFSAHQRNDIISIITICLSLITYSVQIASLFLFKNYYVYLSIQIAYQLLLNIVVAIISKKFYPDYNAKGLVSEDNKKLIGKKIRDLFTAKVGTVVNNSADTIVISAFLGLELLAVFQNYFYIVSALMAVFAIFYQACAAGIGNSLITNSKKENVDLFYNIYFVSVFALNFCCTSLVCLFQPFMQIWVGESLMLGWPFVILFALYLFVEIIPRTAISFKDAGGIWREDRFRPLIVASFNLCLNLVLVNFIGLYGIVISTIVAIFTISLPWLIVNLCRHLIDINAKKYIAKTVLYTFVIGICVAISFLCCYVLPISNIYWVLIARALICIVVPNLIFLLIFWKAKEERYLFAVGKNFVLKLFNRGKNSD